MIKKVQKEYGRFIKKQFLKLFGRYQDDIAENVWSDVWKEYYIDNKSLIDEKFENLNKNLDEESILIAREIFDRYVYKLPWQKYKDSFLCLEKDFYTYKELEAQKESFEADRNKYKLPPHIYYETSIFKYGHGIKLLPEPILENIKTKDFIDGGAFAGDSALALLDYTDKKVHSFEPDGHNFNLLNETISLNNCPDRITPVRLGLGERPEEITVYPTEFCNSVIAVDETRKSTAINIPVTSIDEYVKQHGLEIGLIKLDVEGNELEAIKGALNTIKEQKPSLLVSVYHHPKDFFDIKPLIESIVPKYKFIVRKLNDFSPTYETMLIGWNED